MRITALDFNSVARQRVKINILRQFKFQQIVYASYITYSNIFSVHLLLFYLDIKGFVIIKTIVSNTSIRYFFDLKKEISF